jgi:hypothetical protein
VWVSKGLQAMDFSSNVMELLVKSGKVHRVVPGWKAQLAQKVADYKMDEADKLGDLLNREVAGGGGGALGMGAPSAAARAPTTKLEAKVHLLGEKLTPEVVKYDAIFSFPNKEPRHLAPGELDVASPMAPRKSATAKAAQAKADADFAAQQEGTVAFGGSLKELKKLLVDPERNPFLSADPPKYVEDRKVAAQKIVAAKKAIAGDVKASLAAAATKKVEGTAKLFGALKAAGAEAAAGAKKKGV